VSANGYAKVKAKGVGGKRKMNAQMQSNRLFDMGVHGHLRLRRSSSVVASQLRR
jgi:hypothetical protein